MTMNFDMTASNLGNSISNGSSALEGNKIHDVLFKGVEFSTSKDGNWEFINIKFAGLNGGYFTHRGFGLKANSNERQKSQFGENPSEFESFMMLIKHLLHAVAPEILADMMEGKITFTPKKNGDSLFKQYVTFISVLLEKAKDRTTQIKLITNKKGEAQFPAFFAGLSKDGVVYMKTNFIGEGLKFTDREVTNIAVMSAAVPTAMPAASTDDLSMDDEITTDVKADSSDEDDDVMSMNF